MRTSLVETIQRNEQTTRGVTLGRLMQCLGGARGDQMKALSRAASFHNTPQISEILRNAVAAGSASDATWASPLVIAAPIGSELVKMLRATDIIQMLLDLGARRVGFNIKFPRINIGASVGWVRAGGPAPVSALSLDTVSLSFAKTGGIVVTTDEVMRSDSIDTATSLAADMTASLAAFRNRQFLDPDFAGVADESPPSLTFGLPQLASTGTSIDALTDDAGRAMAQLTDNGVPLKRAVWIMNERLATYIAQLRTTTKAFAFPTMGPNGGTWFGLPCLTSSALVEKSSPTECAFVLIELDSIAIAQDDNPRIDLSKSATLELDTAPTGGATAKVSLFQLGFVAIRAILFCNWVRRRDIGISVVRGVNI